MSESINHSRRRLIQGFGFSAFSEGDLTETF